MAGVRINLLPHREQKRQARQRQFISLAVSLAGKVVGESLEDDARARATVDRFIADLESQAAGAGH